MSFDRLRTVGDQIEGFGFPSGMGIEMAPKPFYNYFTILTGAGVSAEASLTQVSISMPHKIVTLVTFPPQLSISLLSI